VFMTSQTRPLHADEGHQTTGNRVSGGSAQYADDGAQREKGFRVQGSGFRI